MFVDDPRASAPPLPPGRPRVEASVLFQVSRKLNHLFDRSKGEDEFLDS